MFNALNHVISCRYCLFDHVATVTVCCCCHEAQPVQSQAADVARVFDRCLDRWLDAAAGDERHELATEDIT